MANPKHLELARQGKDAWNKWRKENPDEPADFSGAKFTPEENNDISFAGFEFGDRTNFSKTTFGDLPLGISFDPTDAVKNGVLPKGRALFAHMALRDVPSFEGAAFGDKASFDNAVFGRGTSFRGAAFGRVTTFEGAAFGQGASFEGATFGVLAAFRGATFGDWASFEGAAFGDYASFDGAVFGDGVFFRVMPQDKLAALREQVEKGLPEETKARLAELRKDADPEGFSWINFTGAEFRGEVTFQGRTVRERAIFAHVRFAQPPDFWAVTFHEHLDLTGARFSFRGQGISGWTTDTKVADNLRRLRKVASDVHATDAERDLFILERMAERGILWSRWWRSGWWQPASATVLMFFYWILSNCGRSVALPILWFIAANVGAFYVYSRLADTPVDEALRNLTFANMLPFGTLAKPLSEHAAVELFYGGVLPPAVGLAAIGQGVVNALLVFLLALALRNHFKVK